MVEEIRPLTEDAVLVAFTVPDHLREAYRFKHGQHVTLVHHNGIGELRRSYSICAPAGSDGLRIAIRRVPGGAFSGYATEQLRIGETLAVLTPTGRFTTELDASAAKHYGAIAGGSGITPILSMIATILDGEPRSRVTLLYANRARNSTMFFDELEQLQGVHGGRLSVRHYWSREAPTAEADPHRLGPDSVRALLAGELGASPVDRWIMCGPSGLMRSIVATLVAHGVDEEAILTELFTADDTDYVAPGHDRPLVHSEVTLRMDGEELRLELSSHGPTILAAALPLGYDIPYSCSDGVCATCRVKVVEGQVEMDRCSALDRAEIEQGYVLACQAHPIAARVVVDFDA
ncbi:2Fe-2S iron-sulfur cluster-binding protein [Pseudonocardia sp. H11422]|uniref:2Fe-2S iron-sulfur cluster-binding protein n=1 Tax=Pseudonocardia sp. H11422 TaxID=2835866 RepID=UPI00292DD205|nr:2Fe-2S iron-sulfur cluster-binding protein [Pseudonocardia sp. H11422]